MSEENGEGRKIRLITEKGAFGKPGHMIIVRMWLPNKIGEKMEAKSYVVATGSPEEQLEEIERMKQDVIVNPLFASFTILEFISETRPLEEPKIIIHRPSTGETKKFGRSRFMPDGSPNVDG